MATGTAVASFNTPTNREDLLDIVTNISPTDSPFLSSLGKVKATAAYHEWSTDSLASAATNAQKEGADYEFALKTTPARTGAYVQMFQNTAEVSDLERSLNPAGIDDMFAYQMAKCLKEQARDMEKALIGTGAGAAGASGTGAARTLKGALAWITTNTATGATTGTGTSSPEALFNTNLQAIWAAGGDPQVTYVDGTEKRRISAFTASSTKNTNATAKELVAVVDVLNYNLGHVKLGQMLETPKVFNATSSSDTTLIMVQLGRKFKEYYGKSAGKTTRLASRDNRWGGNNKYTNVQVARYENKTGPNYSDSKYSYSNIGKMYDDFQGCSENRSRTSSKINEEIIKHYALLANKSGWAKISQKYTDLTRTIPFYQKGQSNNGSKIYFFKESEYDNQRQVGTSSKNRLLSRRSRFSITNPCISQAPSRILRDYTPGTECYSVMI